MFATCGSATATLRPSGIRPVALIPSQDCDPLLFPTVGVGHPANATVRLLLSLLPAALFPFCAGVPAIGVGHPASIAKSFRLLPCRVSPIARLAWPPPDPSAVVGVGHPVIAVSDVRRTDARRRERDTPEGVTHAFHVSVYKVDPRICVLACNLLSKDRCRLSLRDEVLPGGP